MILNFWPTSIDARMPSKEFPTDAGWDLFPPGVVVLNAGEKQRIDLEIIVWFSLPERELALFDGLGLSWYGRIAERSGLADRGLGIRGGVVDRNYRNTVKVVVYNFGPDVLTIPPEKAICQIIPTIIAAGDTRHMREPEETDRGGRSFGSSDADREIKSA